LHISLEQEIRSCLFGRDAKLGLLARCKDWGNGTARFGRRFVRSRSAGNKWN